MKKSVYLFCLFLLWASGQVFAQTKPEFLTKNNRNWVENTLNSMTLEEKIGQLLMPRGNTSGKGYDPDKLLKWVEEYKVGGIVFFAGQPTIQSKIINKLQAKSKVPLLIGMDLEWGLAMRLDSTVRFPYQMSLGAMQGNDDLIRQMGEEIGRQCKRMGVHVNYAPVVDVNNNPNNPVINFRSFGEDKTQVAAKALAYMKGMQSQRILTSAKHFPGHGDTGVDSHYDLPIISHNKEHLKGTELFPFQALIDNGISGIMTAHLSIPELDSTKNLASTLSPKIVTDLLRKEMNFEGLVFTDAMDMQGAVKYFPNGQALVKAILAGNDILETFEDVPQAVAAIKEAVNTGQLTVEILNERVRKILMAKSWVGLDNYFPVKIEGLVEDLNTIQSDYLNRVFAEKTLTVIKNSGEAVPVKDLTQTIAVVSVDAAATTPFQNMSANYTKVDLLSIPVNANDSLRNKVVEAAGKSDLIIVGLHLANIRPGAKYGITDANQKALKALTETGKAIVVIFGNPYTLSKLEGLDNAKAVILANQLTNYSEEAAAQGVFGAIPMEGRLPVTVSEKYPINLGSDTKSIGRLAYGIPEMVGLDSKVLNARIDSVINLGIREKAYPGAVMEVAKDGRVIYSKTFGFHTYEQADAAGAVVSGDKKFETGTKADVMDGGKQVRTNYDEGFNKIVNTGTSATGKVKVTDLYDFASVTKVSTSLLAVMQLMSENKFSLDQTYGNYYPPFRNTNKEKLTFRNMLTHRSGLKAWIPFWMDCIDTVATLKKAVLLKPELENAFIKTYRKKTVIHKIFNMTPKYKLDYLASIKKDDKLWLKCLSAQTITWKPGIFASAPSDKYTVQVADTLWLDKNYKEVIFGQIASSAVKPEQGYVYSDLHYYAYPDFVPLITGTDWETYLKKTYQAIGAHTLTYNPRRFYSLSEIVPTEKDTLFRKTLIHGRVHDEGAGLLNGISGHAGLFGTANDLTKLMQMYLQKGSFGGQQFIKPSVVDECTSYQFAKEGNRRAIAFDKLDFNKKISNGPQMASPESYGHSGYTGTFTWIDPAYNLVYVFLSNRVYPTRDNVKISTLNIRTEVGNEIYKTIKGE